MIAQQIKILRGVFPALVVAAACFAPGAKAAELLLADQGRSDYRILVADEASPSIRHGAAELQKFLEEITGARLPIVSDKKPQGSKEIILGDNARLNNLGLKIDFAALGDEGYVIRTVGEHLVIAGGALRGTMYGVYGLLEEHLGCRWFTEDVSRIPKQSKLVLGAIDQRQVPVFEYREPYYHECRDADWCARNRVNSKAGRLDAQRGGKINIGHLAHTFNNLVPPQKYFDSHPEYFALVKGKRLRDKTQLCCTNPDVVRICIDAVRERLLASQISVITVSHNDWHNYCECPNCQSLAAAEESQMAPLLQLVNRVAESLEKEFPERSIQTLAYQWTRKPPKTMRPRQNVLIQLCSIECCFSHSLIECDSSVNKAFRDDIERWAAVAPRLWVWDYGVNFSHPLIPFPNLRVLGPNARFFADHNVKGIFAQCCESTPGGEFGELRGYLLAKCLWNPNCDVNRAMDEFLDAVYGKAAGPIRQYIEMVHDKVERDNIHLKVFSKECTAPTLAYLTSDLLTKANMLWQRAERLAANDPDALRRVKLSRMSIDYAIVERARAMKNKNIPTEPKFMRLAATRVEPFLATLEPSSLKYLKAWPAGHPFGDTSDGRVDGRKEAYRAAVLKELEINIP